MGSVCLSLSPFLFPLPSFLFPLSPSPFLFLFLFIFFFSLAVGPNVRYSIVLSWQVTSVLDRDGRGPGLVRGGRVAGLPLPTGPHLPSDGLRADDGGGAATLVLADGEPAACRRPGRGQPHVAHGGLGNQRVPGWRRPVDG